MEAETLNCPMCGAAASTDSTQCGHCGARLATVACPSCFGMMFVGEKFCSHCGAMAERKEVEDPSGRPTRLCPHCKQPMEVVEVGKVQVNECFKCEGIWVDVGTLQQLCADREKQAAVLGMPSYHASPNEPALDMNFRYVPCPVCKTLMNRVNFARCSGVVVDVCKAHGTWFDRDELRRMIEFIRSGGMEKARQQRVEEMEQEMRRLRSQQREQVAGTPAIEMRHSEWTWTIPDAIEGLIDLWH